MYSTTSLMSSLLLLLAFSVCGAQAKSTQLPTSKLIGVFTSAVGLIGSEISSASGTAISTDDSIFSLYDASTITSSSPSPVITTSASVYDDSAYEAAWLSAFSMELDADSSISASVYASMAPADYNAWLAADSLIASLELAAAGSIMSSIFPDATTTTTSSSSSAVLNTKSPSISTSSTPTRTSSTARATSTTAAGSALASMISGNAASPSKQIGDLTTILTGVAAFLTVAVASLLL